MKPLAPPNARGRVSAVGRRLLPPAPTESAVPRELATLTWSAATLGVPAVDDPTWVPRAEPPAPQLRRFEPLPPPGVPSEIPPVAGPDAPATLPVPTVGPWAPPAELPPPASARTGWTWTPIMAGVPSAPKVPACTHEDVIDLSIRLDTFDALIAERTSFAPANGVAAPTEDAAPVPPSPTPVALVETPASTSVRLPSVSFEAASGTVSAERVGGDLAIVTAEVPAFASYAPTTDLVLPDASPMAPPEVEVREAVIELPAPRRRPIRGTRVYLGGLLVAGLAVGGAYLGLREYIYGADTPQDGPRVVEVEPARPVVVPAP